MKLALGAAAGFAIRPMPALAETGVDDKRILFGQAAALEGPASALGTGMRTGILAAFEEANRAGGVSGRKLDLVSVDDGYEPGKAIAATNRLIEDEKVFALIGAVGTPTSNATHPIAEAAGVPFIGPFTGAESLRNPHKPNIVNVRASYFQETEMMVERMTRDLGAKRIAILYQDDAFGRAGLAGTRKAMDKREMALVAEGTFQRNTTAVKMALIEIRRQEPDAVILIGPYRPCAEFIRVARSIDFNPRFINISFVGSNALAKELGADGEGVYITQVVPFPGDASLPLVGRYHAALKAHEPGEQPGFVSLEGYIVGLLTVMALEKVSGEPTRQAFLDAVKSGSFDLGGLTLSYGASDNQGSDDVFLTVINKSGGFDAVTAIG
ncbi:ABC transporter substrate-binding protein [Nitratireductor mangrovi]|uniref:ABC transporter substrate-binding protein n=2 Tax=Nitratireductor mangrovi TaxID=2599600 RepID=A0A5B8L626_9HYPH|nr:ABC transporter substrate-binding protein [Nitratireductor mangrovi]